MKKNTNKMNVEMINKMEESQNKICQIEKRHEEYITALKEEYLAALRFLYRQQHEMFHIHQEKLASNKDIVKETAEVYRKNIDTLENQWKEPYELMKKYHNERYESMEKRYESIEKQNEDHVEPIST